MPKTIHFLFLSSLAVGLLLFAARVEAHPKLLKGGRNQIADQYIVVLHDSAPHPSTVAREHGRAPERVYEHVFKGYSAHIPPGALHRVLNDPRVKSVEPDGIVKAIARPDKPGKPGGGGDKPEPPQVIDWGVSHVGGPMTYSGNNTAWVIDSGIDLDHPDLNVDIASSASFVPRGKVTADDDNGHGTHVAGIIAAIDNGIGTVGVAAGANVASVRVLDKSGSGWISWIIAGVDYVAANAEEGDVANMSLSAYGHWENLHNAITALADLGVHVVAAAGNDGQDASGEEPAHIDYPGVYTVSAIGDDGCLASFSNYGASVDYAAPGVAILSLKKGGGVITYQGTSMAAPHVSGLLLLGSLNQFGYACDDPDGDADPIAHF